MNKPFSIAHLLRYNTDRPRRKSKVVRKVAKPREVDMSLPFTARTNRDGDLV